MAKKLKHKLVVRDGKVIDIANEEEERGNETFSIGKASGLKWGKRNYQETRISTNERGQRRIFKEVKK
jgi:hypothetical protein